MSKYTNEIEKRRTFAIISHPDAGKTTLTEKFLLYGGAINLAGSVKGKATARHAVSDWMEIEKERGISVTSSVLQFHYDGYCINILDTPGHQDFSEDTYRTLMAADSAVMVIDGSKGVEAQTRKLFKVCVMRHIPIFTFINKMDRDANDTFDLLDEIEKELGIATCPINWPIGSGKKFRGVYDRDTEKILTFSDTQKGTKEGVIEEIPLSDSRARGCGVGTLLYRALLELLAACGYWNVYALVADPNPASERIHAQLGFSCVGRTPHTAYKFGWLGLSTWWLALRTGNEKPAPVRMVTAEQTQAVLCKYGTTE